MKLVPKLIIIVAVLAVVGAGGYFAYGKFFAAPKPIPNPYAAIIPEDLKAYDLGQNADGFFVFKNDDELRTLWNAGPQTSKISNIIAAVGYVSMKDDSAAVIVQFASNQDAQAAMETVTVLQAAASPSPPQIKDQFIIFGTGKGLQAFQGSLAENPAVKNIDLTMLDSQLIAYLDVAKVPESMAMMMPLINQVIPPNAPITMLPSAHAQGFISPDDQPGPICCDSTGEAQGFLTGKENPDDVTRATHGEGSFRMLAQSLLQNVLTYTKNILITTRYKNKNLSFQVSTGFLNKEEFINSPIMKAAFAMHPESNTEPAIKQLGDTYDQSMNSLEGLIPTIQEQLKTFAEMNITFDKKTLQITITKSEAEMLKYLKDLNPEASVPTTLEAPQRARDAARKADLNSINAAVETYYADNQKYPQTSGCLEKTTELHQYFHGNTPPTDPEGPQTFGTTGCSSGYYYQFVPKDTTFLEDGYMIWAKMEVSTNGNTNENPETQTPPNTEFLYAKSTTSTPHEGQYYVLERTGTYFNSLSPPPETSSTPPSATAPTKIKRVSAPIMLVAP